MILDQFLQKRQVADPFLWVHVALLAAVPLTLVLTMAGLSVGDPVFPGWLEIPILGIPPIALLVWVQWRAPLMPFTLWVWSRPVEKLNTLQRQILAIVKRPATGWIAIVAGVFLYVIFRQVYLTAPLAEPIAPFPPFWRLLGILWAMVFFLISNLLWQMGIVAARVLILPASELGAVYPEQDILKGFTPIGIPSPQLWNFDASAAHPKQAQSASASQPLSNPSSSAQSAPDLVIPTPAKPISEIVEVPAISEEPKTSSQVATNPPLTGASSAAEGQTATSALTLPEFAPIIPDIEEITPQPVQITPLANNQTPISSQLSPELLQPSPVESQKLIDNDPEPTKHTQLHPAEHTQTPSNALGMPQSDQAPPLIEIAPPMSVSIPVKKKDCSPED